MMSPYQDPESTSIAYGGLAGALLGSVLCAAVAPAAGHPPAHEAAWITMAALAALSLCLAGHRHWAVRGWPAACALAAAAVCASGHPAALVHCGPCWAAITVCLLVIRRDAAAAGRWRR